MTNPSELIAAAHAASFSMTLADELHATGYIAHQIDTTATVTMERIGTRRAMTQVHLDVVATVPDGEQFEFVDAALRAKANCPVSRLLIANISMQAKLKPGSEPGPLPKKSKRSRPKPG
jgi:osmotically inducible protein OsmC